MYEEKWTTDYTGRCGNCKASIKDGELYCRRCGTRRGEGKFDPFLDMMQCIYGPPPVKRVHECTKCKKQWETRQMIDREKFCPDCGGPAVTIEDPRKTF
jgi:rRNA maturation endonuclease Nob1